MDDIRSYKYKMKINNKIKSAIKSKKSIKSLINFTYVCDFIAINIACKAFRLNIFLNIAIIIGTFYILSQSKNISVRHKDRLILDEILYMIYTNDFKNKILFKSHLK